MERKNKSLSKQNKFLLILGFAFFINPVPLGLDLLPDALGCILIYFGLNQLAYFDGAIEKAQKNIFYLFVIESIRLLLMKSVFMTEISTNRMLALTVFSLIEGILYVVFFRQFFGGISYYSMRNNCNKALARSDGCAFMSYLAFFVRIGASLIPEFVAIIEVEKEFATDFETIDSITAIIDAKPVLVVLLSLIALVAGVAWFINICGFLKTFHKESGEEMDLRYNAEYSSRPEMVRPKRLKYWSYVIYSALFFSLDIAFDGIRIIPAAAMFLLLFVSAFFMKNIGTSAKPNWLCIIAAVLFAGSDIFRSVFVPYGAIAIYETELWIVAVSSVIAVVTAAVSMICVRIFLADVRRLAEELGSKDIYTVFPWVSYCIMTFLWVIGYSVPYFYSYISTLRLIFAVVFIWQTAKVFIIINDEESERASLYSK